MSRADENTIVTELMKINGSLGRIEGELSGVKREQSETRTAIADLYELHRHCAGPHLAAEVGSLREEIKARKPSRPPASGGVLLSWDDLRVVAKALPFVVAVTGSAIGLYQCSAAPDTLVKRASMRAPAADTERASHGKTAE